VKELELGLQSAFDGMENLRTQLKKLAAYVIADVLVDEIVWRMLDIDALLESVLNPAGLFIVE
jgi:hypothetical protein